MGDLPRPQIIEPERPTATCTEPFYARDYVVSSGRGLADVLVYIKSGLEEYQFPRGTRRISLREHDCFLEPYLLGAQVGDWIEIENEKNRHPFLMTFASGTASQGWAREADGRAQTRLEAILARPDVFTKIICEVHPWSWGYLGVVEHPFFAVTGPDGTFKLPGGLSPGTYTIAAHHPKAGETTQTIDAIASGKYDLLLHLRAPAEPPNVPLLTGPAAGATGDSLHGSTVHPRPAPGPMRAEPWIAPPPITPVDHGFTGATIRGKVFLSGPAPPERVIKRPLNEAFCGPPGNEPFTTRHYVAGPNGELADAFVHIKTGLAGRFPPPENPVLVEQTRCEFHPYIFGSQAGQKILIRNTDPILHSLRITSTQPGIENISKALPQNSPAVELTIPAPELFLRIRCEVHPWMFAYACVTDHPFFAITGRDGTFAITNVPPGSYTVEVIHRRAGSWTEPVEIRAGETRMLTFFLEAK
jgi:hypothetical protein